jgi:hypothetical protein
MGFGAYPDDIVTTIYVDEEIQLSDITTTDVEQLRYFGIQCFKYGANANVNMKIKAYNSSDELIGESEKLFVSNIPDSTDYFYGWLYFRFEKRINLSNGSYVRFKIELENYSFSEASWFGVVYDWPTTMGYNPSPDQIQDAPYAIDLIGDRVI